MVYVLPPMDGGWTYEAACEDCGAVTRVRSHAGTIRPDHCLSCEGQRLVPVDDHATEEE